MLGFEGAQLEADLVLAHQGRNPWKYRLATLGVISIRLLVALVALVGLAARDLRVLAGELDGVLWPVKSEPLTPTRAPANQFRNMQD